MNADAIALALDGDTATERRRDGLWMELPSSAVPRMAELMHEAEARFVTMTVKPVQGEQLALMYHWDIAGDLLTIKVKVSGSATSVVSLWPAADWVERETRDYYALEFEGRDETPPLMLRDGDKPGLFNRTRKVGRTADPAYTSKTGEEVR